MLRSPRDWVLTVEATWVVGAAVEAVGWGNSKLFDGSGAGAVWRGVVSAPGSGAVLSTAI